MAPRTPASGRTASRRHEAGAMKLAAVVLLLVGVHTVALELLLPAWKRLLSVPNLNKPAP